MISGFRHHGLLGSFVVRMARQAGSDDTGQRKLRALRTPDNPDAVVTTAMLAGREPAPRPTWAAAMIELPGGTWERIANQAYEPWE